MSAVVEESVDRSLHRELVARVGALAAARAAHASAMADRRSAAGAAQAGLGAAGGSAPRSVAFEGAARRWVNWAAQLEYVVEHGGDDDHADVGAAAAAAVAAPPPAMTLARAEAALAAALDALPTACDLAAGVAAVSVALAHVRRLRSTAQAGAAAVAPSALHEEKEALKGALVSAVRAAISARRADWATSGAAAAFGALLSSLGSGA
jgi:hypothetical protein